MVGLAGNHDAMLIRGDPDITPIAPDGLTGAIGNFDFRSLHARLLRLDFLAFRPILFGLLKAPDLRGAVIGLMPALFLGAG